MRRFERQHLATRIERATMGKRQRQKIKSKP